MAKSTIYEVGGKKNYTTDYLCYYQLHRKKIPLNNKSNSIIYNFYPSQFIIFVQE